MKRIFTFLALLSFALLACGPDFIIQESHDFPKGTWAYADSCVFKVNIEDTSKLYNIYVEVAHSDEYDFQNLYVLIRTVFPDGKRLDKVVSLQLADQIGQWNGNCSGANCKLRIPMQENAFFAKKGEYQFVFLQHMRKDNLGGLKSLTFGIEKTKEAKKK
jgi:gliding motility-associated lipoprotein GldH